MTNADENNSPDRRPEPEPLRALEDVLAHEIPISTALGIRPLSYNGISLILTAPLPPNINHKDTAFGGSLYCAAVLTGWGLLHLRMRPHLRTARLHAHIVIQQANVEYRRPVKTDFECICRWPTILDEMRLLRMLSRYGRTRAELSVSVGGESDPAVIFTGRYVIHVDRRSGDATTHG